MFLILTNSRDETASYLQPRLADAGVDVVRLNTDDLHKVVHIAHDARGTRVILGDRTITPQDVQNIWLRRPEELGVSVDGDLGVTKLVRREWSEAIEGFLAQVPADRWINHPAANAAASHKLEQLQRARRFGLLTPDTIVTQDTAAARVFLARHQRGVVCKPLSSGFVDRGHDDFSMIFTSPVAEVDVADEASLQRCPTLFQERIGKTLDVRITVLDERAVAIGIVNESRAGEAFLDVRRDNMTHARYSPVTIPESVRDRLQNLLQSYGLRFAAVDFVIDEQGRWIFLEINPNGQWAWLDISGGCSIFQLFVSAAMATRSVRSDVQLSAVDQAVWLGMRVWGIDVDKRSVQVRRYDWQDHFPVLRASEIGSNATLFEYAKATFDRSLQRRTAVDDKAKLLGGFITFAIPISVTLSTKLDWAWSVFAPLALFTCAALLLLAYFRLGVLSQPSVDVATAQHSEDDLRRQLIADHIAAAEQNERATNFQADVYRASARAFAVGVLTLLALVPTLRV